MIGMIRNLLILVHRNIKINIVPDVRGKIAEGRYWIIKPPRIGLNICPMLVRELFTPKMLPVSSLLTAIVNLLVKIGRPTPVP